MPRDIGTGLYHYPDGTPGNSGQTVFSARYNTFINDLQNTLNQAQPINIGGTGGDSPYSALANLGGEFGWQAVADFNTHVFLPGSFSASGAAINGPGGAAAGHLLIGIAYVGDVKPVPPGTPANVWVAIEARDMQDTTTPGRVYVRERRSGAWGAWAIGGSEAFVLKAGDTMTGPLTIDAAGHATLALDKGGSAFANAINSMTAGVLRWQLRLGDTGDTGSGNVGADINFLRYNDAGTLIDIPFSINRANGSVSLTGDLSITKSDPRLNMTFLGASAAAITSSKVGGGLRWTMALGDGSAEGGANAGSNFNITRYTDAGASIDAPLTINRTTGAMAVKAVTVTTLTSSGNVGIGATAGSVPGSGNTVTGVSVLAAGYIFASVGAGPACEFNNNITGQLVACRCAGVTVGSITVSATNTAFNTSSDARLKQDLKSFDAGHIIDGTVVYDFAWKATGERAYGVVAQEAVTVYDTPIFHDEKEDRWFVDYSKYVPVLLQELKALRARVAALEAA